MQAHSRPAESRRVGYRASAPVLGESSARLRREQAQLQSVSNFSQLVPALPLICHELYMSAREMSFLHAPDADPPEKLAFNADGGPRDGVYTQRKQAMQLNAHEMLRPDEETRSLAHLVRPRSLKNLERNLDVLPPSRRRPQQGDPRDRGDFEGDDHGVVYGLLTHRCLSP